MNQAPATVRPVAFSLRAMQMQSSDSLYIFLQGRHAPWQVKSYLEYQGRKFLDRFDPVTYVKLTEQVSNEAALMQFSCS